MRVTVVAGRAYPLGLANVDTDMIVSSDCLKTISKAGLGRECFAQLRAAGGSVFDDPRYAGAPILVAGANFGCGSSREHAAWALADMGVRAVVAPSFSDIFSNNAFRNGILTAVVPAAALTSLLAAARDGEIRVDLVEQTVSAGGEDWAFAIDPFHLRCLIEGLDEITLALAEGEHIKAHEQRTVRDAPWLATPFKH